MRKNELMGLLGKLKGNPEIYTANVLKDGLDPIDSIITADNFFSVDAPAKDEKGEIIPMSTLKEKIIII
jgi:hypothetical protein